jgi:hypothetical protein
MLAHLLLLLLAAVVVVVHSLYQALQLATACSSGKAACISSSSCLRCSAACLALHTTLEVLAY